MTTVTDSVYQSPVHYLNGDGSVPVPEPTVTADTYNGYAPLQEQIGGALNDFYRYHVEGNLQIFHSMTIGEIVISILLAAIILMFAFKWIYEVIHY